MTQFNVHFVIQKTLNSQANSAQQHVKRCIFVIIAINRLSILNVIDVVT